MRLEIEACAFDIDGTLYPEWKFYFLIIPFVLKNFRLMRAFGQVRRDIRAYQKEHPNEVAQDFFDFQAGMLSVKLGQDKEKTKREMIEKIYDGWKPLFSKIKPYSHVLDVILQLKKNNIKIALLSDLLTEQKQDVWGILPYCDLAMGCESVGALKPSPFPFMALSKALKIQPEKILYVGNNFEYDAVGAKSVGMKTALIKKGFFSIFKSNLKAQNEKIDIIFSDYRQLLKAIL